MALFSLPPGAAQGITQGWDQYTNRQNANQLMEWRRREMEADTIRRQMERDKANRELEYQRGAGANLKNAYDAQFGMPPSVGGGPIANGPQPPAPGEQSIPMNPPQGGGVTVTSLPPGAPGQPGQQQWNWQPPAGEVDLQAGVQPYPGAGPGDMGVVAGRPATDIPLQRPPGYFDQEGGPYGQAQMGEVGAEPKPVIPPYKQIDRSAAREPTGFDFGGFGESELGFQPPPPVAEKQEQVTAQDREAGNWLTLDSFVKTLRDNKVPTSQWMGQIAAITPLLTQQSKDEVNRIQAEYKMGQLENKMQELQINAFKAQTGRAGQEAKAADYESLDDYRDALIELGLDKNEVAKRVAQHNVDHFGQPTPGNINAALNRQRADLKDVNNVAREGAQILGLLDSGDPASMAQIQSSLANFMNQGRQTNARYKANASFGNLYQRAKNAASRLFTGDYSENNKKDIREMIEYMETHVFTKARKNIIAQHKKQAEYMNMPAEAFDYPDPWAEGSGEELKVEGAKKAPTATAKARSKEGATTEELRNWAGSGSTDMGGGWSVKEKK